MRLWSAARCSSQLRRLRGRAAAGFTLIELMVVLGMVAILLSIAVPAYRDTIQRNRVQAEANSFVADVQYARAEAIKRGGVVSICPSTNGSSCSGANAWSVGWLVFVDNGNDGSYTSASDTLLRYRQGWTGGDTFVASPSTTFLKFSGDGFVTGVAATVTMAVHTTPVNDNFTRCVALNIAGHQSVQTKGTGSCT